MVFMNTPSSGTSLPLLSADGREQESWHHPTLHRQPWLTKIRSFCDVRRLWRYYRWNLWVGSGHIFTLCLFALLFLAFAALQLLKQHEREHEPIQGLLTDRPRRIWDWEITHGHHPSRQKVPPPVLFGHELRNPALPNSPLPSDDLPDRMATSTFGTGPSRTYVDLRNSSIIPGYPPRPIPGSIADFDVIMDHCDFSRDKFVPDCLKMLRGTAGLETISPSESSKYMFINGVSERGASENSLVSPCNPDRPRVFHVFWTGPFTDKPYFAILSFLYTQYTGLHMEPSAKPDRCRPQMWLWISPGPVAAVLKSTAHEDMMKGLQGNPWASPFLHSRFSDVIKFKLWNTTDQLDNTPELKEEWRSLTLFNSLGQTYTNDGGGGEGEDDDMFHRASSKSQNSYDQLSVILSDLARFVLCHRFGGIYVDADTVFLRDWEELWGWNGAFSYRWSRMQRYNTAVLHLNKGSALGSFLFQEALNNSFDFHPATITNYTEGGLVEGLLFRLPDALFDSAWLNVEAFQLERPASPAFKSFEDFFKTPLENRPLPEVGGFDGFYKGAYSYHFHNFWWVPVDPTKNWPDLGPRFKISNESLGLASSSDEAGLHAELSWSAVLKRTFEEYIRGERPNMYGEMIRW